MGKTFTRKAAVVVALAVVASGWACSGGNGATGSSGGDDGGSSDVVVPDAAEASTADAKMTDAGVDAADAADAADASDAPEDTKGAADAHPDAVPDATGPGDAAQGHPGEDLVSGGALMTSSNFKLITTLAEGPGGNGVMTSSHYQLRGGLVASSQQ
jgi:hypothetical protein